uniref:Uncharacterized protein n=1 Tax=Helicotheca tamesis TaxID=374047 RepID=A0A7S2HCW7_9STRA
MSMTLVMSQSSPGNIHRNCGHSRRRASLFLPFIKRLVALIFCWKLILLGEPINDDRSNDTIVFRGVVVANANMIRQELPKRQNHDINHNHYKVEPIYNLKFHPYDFSFNLTTTTIDEKRMSSEVHVWFLVPYLEEEKEEEKGAGTKQNKNDSHNQHLKEVEEKIHHNDEIMQIIDSLKPVIMAITNQNAEQQEFRT